MEIAESLPATVDLPFRLRDRDGVIHVEISANEDPDELGHPLVAVGYDEERFRGFPLMTAQIHYAGRGVRAWMGWVQVIERHDDDGNVAAGVDGSPLFGASPLYTFGYLPTLSDFPANPDHPDGNWVADSFLVAIPDVVRTRRLFPSSGFNGVTGSLEGGQWNSLLRSQSGMNVGSAIAHFSKNRAPSGHS